MTEQLNMFEASAPYQAHSGTSKAAAQSIKLTAATLREKVYSSIRRAGERGLTDLEVQDLLHMDGNTQRPRRVELVKANRIKPSGQKRKTSSGRAATVWIAA